MLIANRISEEVREAKVSRAEPSIETPSERLICVEHQLQDMRPPISQVKHESKSYLCESLHYP